MIHILSLGLFVASVSHLAAAVPSSHIHRAHAARHLYMHALRPDDNSTITQGWSLQSSSLTKPYEDLQSCGGGAYCPNSLYCTSGNVNKGVACCSSALKDCRFTLPEIVTCADLSWSIQEGIEGNKFCCESVLVGAIDNDGTTVCVPAQKIMGAKANRNLSRASRPSDAALASLSTRSTALAATTGKPIYFHYMLAGLLDDHAEQDIVAAQAMGADAFAINFGDCSSSWAINAISTLFNYAQSHDFKLFFSFDMAVGFNNPSQFLSFLQSYVTNSAYYKYNNLPMVTTFGGGKSTFGQSSVSAGWQTQLKDKMSAAGQPIYFIPAFHDIIPNSNFFNDYSVCDGAVNWNAWAPSGSGPRTNVPTVDDKIYQDSAKSTGKQFAMAVSPLQFKHLDGNQNWYLRSELNLPVRFGQVLSMQPDMIEMITWNDAGEGHNMGYVWDEAINFPSNQAMMAYATDHTAYDQILPSFFKAFKAGATDTSSMFPTNGKSVQGLFYHHSLLRDSKCNDNLGKPAGSDGMQDQVTAVVVVTAGVNDLSISISSGGTELGTQALKPGLNTFTTDSLTLGEVTAAITDASGNTVVSGKSPVPVTDSGNLYNYNIVTTPFA